MSEERELAIIKYKNARIEELVTENARLTARVEQLEAELTEARQDAERLTFAIEREGRFYRVGDGTEIVFSFLDRDDRSIAIHDDIRGADGRAAIDAALEGEKCE